MTKREKARADWLYVQLCSHRPNLEVCRYELFDTSQLLYLTAEGKTYLYDELNNHALPRYISLRKDEKLDKKTWMREFSYRVQTKMIMEGMGIEMLSYVSGLSEYSIERYMNGESIPSARNLQKLALALRCSVDDLLRFPTCLN